MVENRFTIEINPIFSLLVIPYFTKIKKWFYRIFGSKSLLSAEIWVFFAIAGDTPPLTRSYAL